MELLDQAYKQEKYLDFLADKFNFSKSLQAIIIENNEVESFEQLGFISTADNKQLPIFEIYIKPNTKLARNRVQLRNLVAKQISAEDGALAVYVDENSKQWRFSFIAIKYKLDDNNKLTTEQTASQRFTYLLGKDTQTRTAKERFELLNKKSSLEELKTAFAVGTLTDDFYKDIYKWYLTAQSQVTFPNDEGENQQKHTQNSLIRLLTRLLFIWFLKEKHLINPDLFNLNQLKNLIDWNKDSSFYKAILQNLFFATLNRQINKRDFRSKKDFQGKNKHYGKQYNYRYHDLVKDKKKWQNSFSKTPFLNGGLFESLDRKLEPYLKDKQGKFIKDKNDNKIISNIEDKELVDEWNKTIRKEKYMIRVEGFSDKNLVTFPNNLFFNTKETGLIDLLGQYQFTVEESTPFDIEVALDPELLGKVFENLLASYNHETGEQARKATGSFYTPREIVNYMVDESLKQHFKTHSDLSETQINSLFIEGESNLDEEQIKTTIKAIDGLKILDPAVGSGAYPMGLLQRMTALLSILDPDNKKWQQQQLNALPSLKSIEQDLKTIEQINDKQAKQKAKQELEIRKQEIKTRFKNEDHNYLRKLYLIENCIYGVDIQPIAIQICKLRFFISLTIEQKTDKDKHNFGIQPLPNLDYHFEVGNSLLGLPTQYRTENMPETVNNLLVEIKPLKHKFFSETNHNEKKWLKDDIKNKINKCYKQIQDSIIKNEKTEKTVFNVAYQQDLLGTPIQQNYNTTSKQNQIKTKGIDTKKQIKLDFDFKIDFNEVFTAQDGFDIVIGNPPYIRQESIKEFKTQFKQRYQVFTGTADIYTYFYEKGFNLLSKNGHLCYITSNKWMRAKYGEKLRLFFKNNTKLQQIIDFEGTQIFENATVDTNILLTAKTGNNQAFNYQKQLPNEKNQLFTMAISDLSDNAYTLQPPEILDLKKKIEKIGTPLKDWDININYGIKTGFNEAFIIDNDTKQALCKQDPKSAEIIKPILRGRDIKAYEHNWAGLWIINSHNGDKNNPAININDYSAIKTHLDQYYPQLEKRLDKGRTPYNLRNCAYLAEFKKEKIVWTPVNGVYSFTYLKNGTYFNNSIFMITSESASIKFMLAILNSKLIQTKGMELFTNLGIYGHYAYGSKDSMQQLPIPKISKPAQQPFIDLVDKILATKKYGKDTSDLEAKIDTMVYQLYDLTAAEISLISDSLN